MARTATDYRAGAEREKQPVADAGSAAVRSGTTLFQPNTGNPKTTLQPAKSLQLSQVANTVSGDTEPCRNDTSGERFRHIMRAAPSGGVSERVREISRAPPQFCDERRLPLPLPGRATFSLNCSAIREKP
ncbi:hypothetical protein AAFF_G00190850 [Aldrovandia affinis]|uniref:Uncharacterized protein n=1 Tax=Aldrovandia affinis TaxID=143900 RepID=A0AAD7RM33_9TELE|nr:hypothetical protein AAFF_G00190850 [Aldrovandia affinis]